MTSRLMPFTCVISSFSMTFASVLIRDVHVLYLIIQSMYRIPFPGHHSLDHVTYDNGPSRLQITPLPSLSFCFSVTFGSGVGAKAALTGIVLISLR